MEREVSKTADIPMDYTGVMGVPVTFLDKYNPELIDSVRRDFPLNVMYWAVRNDGNYEVIDGQQRTLSICQYVNGDFSINGLAFHNWRGFSLVNSDSCVSPVRERMGRVS